MRDGIPEAGVDFDLNRVGIDTINCRRTGFRQHGIVMVKQRKKCNPEFSAVFATGPACIARKLDKEVASDYLSHLHAQETSHPKALCP